MNKESNGNRLDRFLTKCKNQPLIMFILICVIIIVGIASFTDSVQKITQFFSSGPTLKVIFQPTSFGEMLHGHERYGTIFLQLLITNEGKEPLTPVSFNLEYKKDNEWVRFENVLIPENNFKLWSVEQEINIEEPHKKDLLKFDGSIRYAEPVRGFLLFRSNDVSLDDLNKRNASRLICRDILGNEWIEYLAEYGDKITKQVTSPKFGVTIRPKNESEIDMNMKGYSKITTEVAKEYAKYFRANLSKRPEAIEYLKEHPKSELVFPEKIQFLFTSTGTVIIHWGYGREVEYTKLEFQIFNVPYQQVLFGENISDGAAAIDVVDRATSIQGLTVIQNQTNGAKSVDADKEPVFGQRLIDVSSNSDLVILDCQFTFRRNNKLEIFSREYMAISGSTNITVLSKAAADLRINEICSRISKLTSK